MPRKPAKKKNPWRGHGVVTGNVNVAGPKINVRTRRPQLNVTKEQGVHVRSRKVKPKNAKKNVTI